MKTLTILTIAVLTFATSAFAKSNEKFYQVNDNGSFQYTYWAESGNENAKTGIKPVTLRTFFLETEKNGLLPFAMSYIMFEKLSVEEKQAILAGSQYDIIAAMESTEEIVAVTATAAELMISPVEAVKVAEVSIEEVPAAKRIAIDINAPWLVKAVTTPGTETDLPADKEVEITIEHNNELPHVVDLMINDGGQIEAKIIAEEVKISKSLRVSK